MLLTLDTGDSNLKRQLKEAKSNHRMLKYKMISLDISIGQLKKQLDIKAELLEKLAQFKLESKEMVTTINQREETLGELMKEAV